MPYNFFKPKPGRFGVTPNVISRRLPDSFSDEGVEQYSIGSHPAVCYINQAVISSRRLIESADSVTGVLQKYDASASAFVVLSSPVNMQTLTPNVAAKIPFLATLTDAQRTLGAGDTLSFFVTMVGTTDVNPRDYTIDVELLVQE
jgi:hypothetical protein